MLHPFCPFLHISEFRSLKIPSSSLLHGMLFEIKMEVVSLEQGLIPCKLWTGLTDRLIESYCSFVFYNVNHSRKTVGSSACHQPVIISCVACRLWLWTSCSAVSSGNHDSGLHVFIRASLLLMFHPCPALSFLLLCLKNVYTKTNRTMAPCVISESK